MKTQEGVREKLKLKIPERYWPVLKFFDKYIIDLLYLGYLLKRIGYKIKYHDLAEKQGQKILTFNINAPFCLSEAEEFFPAIKKQIVKLQEGRHSFYLGHSSEIEKVCSSLNSFYPHPFGLKIIKSREISSDGTPYYTSKKLTPVSNAVTMRAVGSIYEKAVISNLLNLKNVAPRVYDVIRLKDDYYCYYAMVVQHINGSVVTGKKGIDFIKTFKKVLSETEISTIGIKNHADLRPPDFRNNIVADESGIYYVDIQNFIRFPKIDRNCRKILSKQTVNKLKMPLELIKWRCSKQNTGSSLHQDVCFSSFDEIDSSLSINKLSFKNKKVLDVGGETGILCMYALSRGARWCVGLRQPELVEKNIKRMFEKGFTRFDIISNNADRNLKPEELPFKKYDMIFYSSSQENLSIPKWIKHFKYNLFIYMKNYLMSTEEVIDKIKEFDTGLKMIEPEMAISNSENPHPFVFYRH